MDDKNAEMKKLSAKISQLEEEKQELELLNETISAKKRKAGMISFWVILFLLLSLLPFHALLSKSSKVSEKKRRTYKTLQRRE